MDGRVRNSFRFLPLSLCIAAALPVYAQEADDMWQLCPLEDAVPPFLDAPPPVGEPGDRENLPTDIAGDVLDGDPDSTVFQGNVELTRGDQFLGTDQLVYDSQAGTYTAEGSVRYQDSGMRILAERAHGDQAADRHTIEDLRYQLISRRGNGGAEKIEMEGEHGLLLGSTYSTCPPSERAWELQADRIDIDTEEGMAVARSASIRIGKVPVMYVPWLMFPIDDRRRTGLLWPSMRLSGRNGFDYEQPVYLNLAPNYDATLSPRIMTERGVSLGAEFRWLYEGGRGTLEGAWMPTDRLPENEPERYAGSTTPPTEDRGTFKFNATHALGGNWRATANLGWVSDPHYLEDFSNSQYGMSAWNIRSSVGIYGRGLHWDAGLMADHNQLADYTLTERNLRYDRLPRAFINWEEPVGRWFQAGISAEAVKFQHDVRDEGSRLDVKPFLALPLEGPSWYLTPKLAWRYTAWELDDELAAANGGEDSPSRSLPITSLDAGLFFDRQIEIAGESFLNTLEPRIYYLHVPYRDQSGLPRFDTNPMTFSWGQLFRDNRYTGPDRQIDANQLTTALTTRLISEEDGRERLAASIGQIHYFDDSRVTLNRNQPPLEAGRSSWVADVGVAPTDRWTINASYQWDPKERREDLISLRTRYLLGDRGVVNLGYRYRRDLAEQVDFSFLYPVNREWSLVGRYYYSLDERKVIESIAGVQWESCCMAARLVARRYIRHRSGDLDDSLRFEIELKGLGSAGQKSGELLRRAILGYERDDLYLVPPSSLDSDSYDPSLDPIP